MGWVQPQKARELSRGFSGWTEAVPQEFSESGGQMTLQGIEGFEMWIAILIASYHLSLQLIGSDSRNVCRHKGDRDSICPSYPGWDGGSEGKARVPGNHLCNTVF